MVKINKITHDLVRCKTQTYNNEKIFKRAQIL